MDRHELRERDDILLFESPSGLTDTGRRSQVIPIASSNPAPALVLYAILLFGVHNRQGEQIDGDALIVRARDQPDRSLLAAVFGCSETELQPLLDRGGTWAIRQITSIDGYGLRFDPN